MLRVGVHLQTRQLHNIKLSLENQKESREIAGLFSVWLLAHHCYVAGLRSFGSLFNIELDLLSFGQVAEAIALNGRKMDEDVLSTFALNETETLDTVEPLDRTDYSFRHCICLLRAVKKLDNLFVPSEGKTKQPTESNRELWLFFLTNVTYRYHSKLIVTGKTK